MSTAPVHNFDPVLFDKLGKLRLSMILRHADQQCAGDHSGEFHYRVYLWLETELELNGFDTDAAYTWYYGATEDPPQRFDSDTGNWTDPRCTVLREPNQEDRFLFGLPDGNVLARRFPFSPRLHRAAEYFTFYSDTHPETR